MHNPGDLIKVYATVVNSDRTEGRGASMDLAYFMTYDAALRYGKGQDVMGSDGKVAVREVVVCQDGRFVLAKFIEVSDTIEDLKISAARAKLDAALTPEEKKLLGIS